MRIIFSRKGFDSGSGGMPSPIINNRPISLPIPKNSPQEPFQYQDIEHPTEGSLGPIVEEITKGRLSGTSLAHFDPQLPWTKGTCSLGQDGAAQSHLINQGVTVGDAMVFFGLFKDYHAPKSDPNSKPHHRIFGYMKIDRMVTIEPSGGRSEWGDIGLPRPHPHTERTDMHKTNAIWIGTGAMAKLALPELRLTAVGESPSKWIIPHWLQEYGLSYHHNKDRWGQSFLSLAARGQEFVSNVGSDQNAAQWLQNIEALCARNTGEIDG